MRENHSLAQLSVVRNANACQKIGLCPNYAHNEPYAGEVLMLFPAMPTSTTTFFDLYQTAS